MSFYTFATDSLTTFADLRRRPAIDGGQLQRTLSLFAAFAVAFAVAAHCHNADMPAASKPLFENQTIGQ